MVAARTQRDMYKPTIVFGIGSGIDFIIRAYCHMLLSCFLGKVSQSLSASLQPPEIRHLETEIEVDKERIEDSLEYKTAYLLPGLRRGYSDLRGHGKEDGLICPLSFMQR